MSAIRRAALALLAVLTSACGHLVPLVPDGTWHTVYSIQVPERTIETTVKATTAPRADCDPSRVPEPTEVRIVLSESFQDLSRLPERLTDAAPRPDGIPTTLADSGPYDLTLNGATRVLPLGTRQQLLARTRDRCTALRLWVREPPR